MSQSDESGPSVEGNGTDGDGEDAGTDSTVQSVSSSSRKVVGETNATDATGVLGRTTATSSVTYGVVGETESDGDGATGVRGHATASGNAAETYGVRGIADADGDVGTNAYPRGVLGEATGDGRTFGVHGRATGPGATGVVGQATSGSLIDFTDDFPVAVYGETDRDGGESGVTGAAGVYGMTSANGSGSSFAVFGQVSGSADDAYAFYGVGHSYFEGNVEVRGSRSTSQIGGITSLSDNQVVTTDTETRVAFDDVKREDTAVGSFDTAGGSPTGAFTFAQPGDYVVEWQIDWDNGSVSFNDTEVVYSLQVNGDDTQPGFLAHFTESGGAARNFSKPIWDVNSGDTVSVTVEQRSGSDAEIEGWTTYHDSYLSVRKFG